MQKKSKAFLFDLDGTLIDTCPDLLFSLNSLLKLHGKPIVSDDLIRSHIGLGARSIVKTGFQISELDPELPALHANFLEIYKNNISRESRLFSGIRNFLAELDSRQIPWGIVTNKAEALAKELVNQLEIKAQCLIGGDTLAHCKPHPEPILHACQKLNIVPENTYFVGDGIVDMRAGKAAGCDTLLALYGYLNSHEKTNTWGAAGYLYHPDDLWSWL